MHARMQPCLHLRNTHYCNIIEKYPLVDTRDLMWSDLAMAPNPHHHHTHQVVPPRYGPDRLFFSYSEVAGIYGISVATVRRRTVEKRITVTKVGRQHRIHRDDIRRFGES
ncbi:helix-turn-helix domain-containing protein [Gordonia oleivorans]|uniref:helix-turn-helix domain-containing protein n=1 Tax=Gordonia oleivorans TaxID=3156618 RepID=UPI003CCD8364